MVFDRPPVAAIAVKDPGSDADAVPYHGSARKCQRRRGGSLTLSGIDYLGINELDQARSARLAPKARGAPSHASEDVTQSEDELRRSPALDFGPPNAATPRQVVSARLPPRAEGSGGRAAWKRGKLDEELQERDDTHTITAADRRSDPLEASILFDG